MTADLLQIAHNDFPIPRIPQPSVVSHPPPAPEPRFLAPLPPSSSSDPAEPGTTTDNEPAVSSPAASSQETNKENAAPPKAPAPTPESAPAPESAPESAPAPTLDPGILPPQITAMLAEITGVLTENFHTYPPHTIQRLAELVLQPRRHYRSLPAYLHAVDRVVHVTSGNNIYPLPPAIPDMSHMMINNATEEPPQTRSITDGGTTWASLSSSNATAVGSDEALGGALLTPIPWLARRVTNGDGGSESGGSPTVGAEGSGPSTLAANQGALASQQRQAQGRQYEMQVRTESTETIEGPNGMGSIETVTVSVNGLTPLSPATQQRVITQGELIRQEQRAGVVPVSQLARTGSIVVTSSSSEPAPVTPASAETSDAAMAEGEGADEGPKDGSSEKSDEEMVDEDELPHARGPDIIGAADMGPQTPSSSTFSISSGGNVEVRGIDVEAAVGRRHEATAAATSNAAVQSESSPEGGAAAMTPASSEAKGDTATAKQGDDDQELPNHNDAQDDEESNDEEATSAALSSPLRGKREAEDDIAETESVNSKRRKATPDNDEKEPATESTSTEASEKAKSHSDSTEEQQKDGEGDTIISDATVPSTETEPTSKADDTGANTGKKEVKETKEEERKTAIEKDNKVVPSEGSTD